MKKWHFDSATNHSHVVSTEVEAALRVLDSRSESKLGVLERIREKQSFRESLVATHLVKPLLDVR